jgi:hypothetical protein
MSQRVEFSQRKWRRNVEENRNLGRIIARRGSDILRLPREAEGKRYGYIVFGDGSVSKEMNVDSVLSRGYWSPASGTEALKSYIKALENGPGQ